MKGMIFSARGQTVLRDEPMPACVRHGQALAVTLEDSRQNIRVLTALRGAAKARG